MNLMKAALLAAWLAFGCGAAQAATTCTLGAVAGFTVAAYVEGVASSPQALSVIVNCTRPATADPGAVTWTLTFDTGSNNNRASAVVGGTTYYTTYAKGTASTCSPALTTSSGTITWPTTGAQSSRIGTLSATVNYYGCVPAQSGMAAATYQDSIGLTLTNNVGSPAAAGSVPVSITLGPACTFSGGTNLGTMTFNYTAFRASPLVVNFPFGATCTNTTPYTLAIDVTTGVSAGLAYSLALSAPGGTGTGSLQNYNIIGTMAAGQPGDCTGSCTGASNVHNVTVSY
jgi:hypothetical protein